MSTHQVSRTVTTRTTHQSESSSKRARSPSPARISRLQEKDQLTSLNDRLAAYIDHIRSLETENEKLLFQVQSFEETSEREVSNIKDLYEGELASARKLMDELSKENAQAMVSLGTYKSEAEEWMRKYTQKDRELSSVQKKLADLEGKMADLDSKLAQALRDAARSKESYQQSKSDVADLERQLASARKQLEEETLSKVDLENRVQSLKEELEFKARLHSEEINETRTRLEYTMDETDSRTQKEVEHRLQESLADLRRQHEQQTQIYKEELESIYESKISGLEKELSGQSGVDEKTIIEMTSFKTRISELQGQITKLTNQNASLEAQVATLEGELASERDLARSMSESKDRDIRSLRNQMQEQMREYQDLLDIKISLDLEIAAYRKLLEGEEERLNLSQSVSQSAKKSTPRKRRRGDDRASVIEQSQAGSYESSGTVLGSVEICDVSEDGRYIKIRNMSDEVMSLAGWKLIHKADDKECEYKFHRSAKLGNADVATVWSSDAGAAHDASTLNFVMKNQKWSTGDNMLTSLQDKESQLQATHELKRSVQRTVKKASRRQETTMVTNGDAEEGKSCIVM